MKYTIIIPAAFILFSFNACSQNTAPQPDKPEKTTPQVGGPCEGCEAIYECPVPFEQLSWTDTLPDFNEPGPKLMISGIIYQVDGKTPARDVVLYIYHTGQDGKYVNKNNEKGWAKRHGYIRGWMKTNEKGEYAFYTLLPASYPNSTALKHIHPTIKEPGKNEYYIDEYIFDDDPFLTPDRRKQEPEQRGGGGLIKLKNENGILAGERNIYLGKNIPGYPASSLQSGLPTGSNCPAFDPIHLSGADKGKRACPMCKYGYQQGVMVWFNHTSLDEMKRFTGSMESEMVRRGAKKFRVFMIYMNPTYKINDEAGQRVLREKIIEWCRIQNLNHVAMLWVPSPVDEETCGLYDINPLVKNTVLFYKKRNVVASWVNIEYDDQAIKAILDQIDM